MKKKISILSLIVALTCIYGCDAYNTGSVTVDKKNGKVNTIRIVVSNPVTLSNREEADRYIENMESLLLDIKNARDSMPIVESKQTQPNPEQPNPEQPKTDK